MTKSISIGIIGDFNPDSPSHVATDQAIQDAAANLSLEVKIDWLPTLSFRKKSAKTTINQFKGLFAASTPYRDTEADIKGIRLAREMNIPFLGT